VDAIFCLNHLINKARWQSQRLYVVFVDFKKAFDRVRRDVLLERCSQVGVHGPFLSAVTMLYDKVQQQVCVDGQLGPIFDTFVGTKQGSELSPLLFGMFMDLLHELILMRVDGAGPVVGALRVPNVDFVDDVTLIAAIGDWNQSQELLDCLELFCDLFGMEVNTALDTTCAVVFRKPRMGITRGVVLTYKGAQLPFQDTYKHLGLVLHCTRGMVVAADALAVSGDRAVKALQSACRQQHITQFDMKCRLFDALVEPVLSYASHVWGPELFAGDRLQNAPYGSEADKLHASYLRRMVGAGRSTCIDVLLRDFCRSPVMHHWVILAARWFSKLAQMDDDRLAHQAWLADIALLLQGCDRCWSFYLFSSLSLLGVVQRDAWDIRVNAQLTSASVRGICLPEEAVKIALTRQNKSRWNAVVADPRTGPVVGSRAVHARSMGAPCRCSWHWASQAPHTVPTIQTIAVPCQLPCWLAPLGGSFWAPQAPYSTQGR
jgi:hypothetical protein